MTLAFTKTFDKQFEKLPQKLQLRVKATLIMFLDDPSNRKLRNHKLVGNYLSIRSISAGGDLRLHYQLTSDDVAEFESLGTHSQLYK
jgi:addiction module RelE/StbE family toxin